MFAEAIALFNSTYKNTFKKAVFIVGLIILSSANVIYHSI